MYGIPGKLGSALWVTSARRKSVQRQDKNSAETRSSGFMLTGFPRELQSRARLGNR
jgi:hypothetical protein